MHPHRGRHEMVYRATRGAYENYNQMVLEFLNHFQFLVCYDVGIELLWPSARTKPPISWITSKSGVDKRG
jgi:hypothetical protein